MRVPSQPGPGGYAGGVGATDSSPAEPGARPGGGGFYHSNASCGSYNTSGCGNDPGPIYGNSLLVPLRGGSGGAGETTINGAGGGAIQIVSSVSITIGGSILSNGGTGNTVNNQGRSGSGGAIHLEAPIVTGAGTVQAVVVGAPYGAGGSGWIRIDATTNSLTGTITPTPTVGPLFNSPLPTAVPTVKITSIKGVAVPALPTASFTVPDVTINSGVAVPVVITASNIPLDTVVNLYVSSETGADQTIAASALTGTVASSTGTASLVWPVGVSRVFARASW